MLRLLVALALLVGTQGLRVLPGAAQVDVAAFLAQPTGPLPAPLAVEDIARLTVALHEANGGSTVNRYFGDLVGQRLYAVVVYPEFSRTVAGATIQPAWVEQFALDHAPLLEDPRNNVGTWYSRAEDRSYLELTSALPDREQALALGRRYNQMNVFDLLLLESIETGGMGTPPADLPPLLERLPPFQWPRH